MLLPGVGHLLGLENLEVLAESTTGLGGLDDVVDESSLGGHERVGEVVGVLGLVLLQVLSAEDNLHSSLSSHDGNLTVRPRVVAVSAQVLGGHDAVSTSVALAGDHGHLGHGGLGVGVDELGSLTDNSAVLLVHTGQESGHIHEGHQRNVEGIAEAHETGSLHGGVDVQASGQLQRLVGHHSHSATLHATETHHDVLGEVGGGLEELVVVHHHLHQLLHVVGHVGVSGHDVVQGGVSALAGVVAHAGRHAVLVVQGKVVVEGAHSAEHLHVVVVSSVGNAGLLGVDGGTSQLLLGDVLSSHGLHHIGTGDEHVRGIAHHEDEIGDGGGVHSTSSAGSHDQGDLGDHSGRQSVALEDLRVSGQRVATLLNTGTARVVQTDDGSTHVHGLVHDLADLLGVGAGQRSSQHGEVLGEQEDQTAVDGTVTSDHTIAGVVLLLHSKVHATVSLQLVVLAEGALIDQKLDSLASSQLAALVLTINALLASSDEGLVASLSETLSEGLREIHSSSKSALHKLDNHTTTSTVRDTARLEIIAGTEASIVLLERYEFLQAAKTKGETGNAQRRGEWRVVPITYPPYYFHVSLFTLDCTLEGKILTVSSE